MDFGEPTKLHYGKQVAAALAFIGLVNHDRVDHRRLQQTGSMRQPAQRPGPVADASGRASTWTGLQADQGRAT